MTLAIGLLVLGLVLIVAELVVTSMGILSVLAVASLAGSVISAFSEGASTGVGFVVACAVLVPATLILGGRLVPRSPLGKLMIVSGLSHDSVHATDARDLTLVGKRGTVEAPLRPAGMARIEGRRVDVVSRGESIEAGTAIEVVEVRGNRVVVAPASESGSAATARQDPARETTAEAPPPPVRGEDASHPNPAP